MARPIGQRGQAIVVVALSMTVLLGAAGLAIDGGRLYLERRNAQGAADHAATTAAHARCTGQNPPAAIAAGKAAAARNGYDDDGVTNIVTVTQHASNRFRATVSAVVPATFARVLGFADMDVAAQALAGCEGGTGTGPGAIFAGGDNCTNSSGKPGIKVNGSTSRVYGGIHSNSDIGVSGSTNFFTNQPIPPDDAVTYVGLFTDGGSNNDWQDPTYPQYVGPAAQSWPSGWGPSDIDSTLLDAYRARAQTPGGGVYSTNQITSIVDDGVYYTESTNGIDISTFNGTVRNVVLVAPNGPIKMSADNRTINAYAHPDLPREGVIMVTGKTYTGLAQCDTFTIDISGSTTNWNGIMWAPGGLIKMAGSSNATARGSLVAWAVELNGSDLTIQYDDSYFTGGGEVLLYE